MKMNFCFFVRSTPVFLTVVLCSISIGIQPRSSNSPSLITKANPVSSTLWSLEFGSCSLAHAKYLASISDLQLQVINVLPQSQH